MEAWSLNGFFGLFCMQILEMKQPFLSLSVAWDVPVCPSTVSVSGKVYIENEKDKNVHSLHSANKPHGFTSVSQL